MLLRLPLAATVVGGKRLSSSLESDRELAMYQPETYVVSLLLMIISMLCWGSWANTVKLCPGYRFQLFYWDYVIGLILGSVAWGLTLGSFGATGSSFVKDI